MIFVRGCIGVAVDTRLIALGVDGVENVHECAMKEKISVGFYFHMFKK